MNILVSIYELFNAEITTSQIQHSKKGICEEEILKSQFTNHQNQFMLL